MNNTLDHIIDQLDKHIEQQGIALLNNGELRDMLVQVNTIEYKVSHTKDNEQKVALKDIGFNLPEEFNQDDYILKSKARNEASEAFIAGVKYAVTKHSINFHQLYTAAYEWVQQHTT